MRFYPLTDSATERSGLEPEYKGARQIGKLRLGGQRLYFRSGGRVYYIPYEDIRRYFRRVQLVPARLCCGRGDLEIENLVICSDAGELAQIQLPGTKAAKAVMDSLAELAPAAISGRPQADAATSEPVPE